MFVEVKNMPRLCLSHLLRRRKTTLERFVKESGIQTYSALCTQCDRLGVLAPTASEYEKVFPTLVTSPADGVIVVEPIPVIDDLTGRHIDPDAPVTNPGIETFFSPEEPESRRARKRRQP
jgi:hypothetical protein